MTSHDSTPPAPDHDDELVPLSFSLDGVVKSLRGPSRRAVAGLFGRWSEAVGEQVAQHVRPVKLDAGVLSVDVDDPAWATQVKFLAPTIIARLAEVAGARVERIQVRVDPRAARGEDVSDRSVSGSVRGCPARSIR